MLSEEGGRFTKTIGMLAERQPPFKQSVTADLSSESAPKMIGTKHIAENMGSSIYLEER